MNSRGILRTFWGLLDRPLRRQVIVLQLLSVLMAFSTVSGIAAVVPFFSVLAAPTMIVRNATLHGLYGHFGFASERAFVIALGLAFVLAVALSSAMNLAGSVALHRFSHRVGDAFQAALFEEFLYRDYAFHAASDTATLASKVIYETGRVTGGVLQSLLSLIANLITILLIVGTMVVLNPRVAACALGVLGAAYTAVYLAVRGRLLENGQVESRYFVRRTRLVNEGFSAIKEIIVLNAYGHFVKEFKICCTPISSSLVSTHMIGQSPRYVLEIATVGCLVILALWMSGGPQANAPWIAQLSFVGLAAYRLLPALQQLFAAAVQIRADRPAFDLIAQDLQRARAALSPRAARCAGDGRAHEGWPRREIRLDRVFVSYAANRAPAISNISLCLRAGSRVGLIGANGSGKTTLADVLAGLALPQTGRLEVDGIAIDAGNRRAWRSTVAYVTQHPLLLDATLAQNIAFGIPPAQIDWHRLREAVRLARLEACIASLPAGYEERVGERGCRLSGGERQRVGIARALYRRASVLILDEATSALDAEAEAQIVDSLGSLGSGWTILLIAHRMSSLRHCDRVLELKGGRIVRSGSYGEVAAGAGYRHMAR